MSRSAFTSLNRNQKPKNCLFWAESGLNNELVRTPNGNSNKEFPFEKSAFYCPNIPEYNANAMASAFSCRIGKLVILGSRDL